MSHQPPSAFCRLSSSVLCTPTLLPPSCSQHAHTTLWNFSATQSHFHCCCCCCVLPQAQQFLFIEKKITLKHEKAPKKPLIGLLRYNTRGQHRVSPGRLKVNGIAWLYSGGEVGWLCHGCGIQMKDCTHINHSTVSSSIHTPLILSKNRCRFIGISLRPALPRMLPRKLEQVVWKGED